MTILFRKPTTLLPLLALVLLLASCAKTTTTNVNSAPTTVSTMEVFYSAPTDREYTELGLVTTQTGQTIFHDKSAAGMIEKLKAEAAKLDADAIIVRSANEGTWGLKGGGNTGFSRGNAQAVAIKFK